MSTIQETFEKAFHRKLSYAAPYWFPTLGSLITFEDKFKLVSLSLTHYTKEEQEEFADTLNFIWGNEQKPHLFSLLRKKDGTTFLTFSYKTLEKMASPEMAHRETSRYNILKNYYERFLNKKLHSMALGTVNLQTEGDSKSKWLTEFLNFEWIEVENDEGKHSDIRLLFARRHHQISGYEPFSERIENFIANLTGFLRTTSLLSEEQREKLDNGLLEEIEKELFFRTQTSSEDSYIPSINLQVAQKLHDCGIGIDLGKIYIDHMKVYSHPHVHTYNEAMDAKNVFAKIFNLPAFERRELKFSDRVIGTSSANIYGNAYEPKTGLSAPWNDTPYVSMSLNCLTQQEAIDLKDAFNLACDSPDLFQHVEEFDAYLKIDYEHVENFLKQGISYDLSGIFEKTASIQAARISRAQSALDDLGDIFGYRGWKGMGYPKNFYKERYGQERISICFANEFLPATPEDGNTPPFPGCDAHPECDYTSYAGQISAILLESGVSKIRLNTSQEDYLELTAQVDSVDEVEELAAKLAPFKDRLNLLTKAIVAQSTRVNHIPLPIKHPLALMELTAE